jgi:hypothetical protein
VRFVGAYAHKTNEHHLYHVRPRGEVIVAAPDEIAGVAWFTLDEVAARQVEGTLFADFMLAAIRQVLAPDDDGA